MTRQKKIYIGLAGFTGFLLILLLIFHYLESSFANSEWTRKKVQTIISQKTGGNADYKTAELSLIPYIHAKIHQANISIPEKGNGTIKTLNITPKILPLFIGKFIIDEIQIESPDMEMIMTRFPENGNEAKEPFNLDTFKDTLAGVLSPLATELPEFQATINDGRFNLIEDDETVFALSNVQAEIGSLSTGIEIKMNGTSKICEEILVNASFSQKSLKGKGEVELRHFQPQALINLFLPNATYRITKPINKVSVSLKTDGANDLQVVIDEIQIESPDIEMVITRSPENGNKAKGPFNLDTFKDTVTGVLSPLATELPEFHATIKDGGFKLIEEDETVFTLSNVQAEIGCLSKEIKAKINSTSNICEDISVNAGFDQKDLKGKGEVELKHFQPQTLINRFLPNAAYRITKPINKMSLSLKTDGPNDLQVDIDKINVSAEYDGIPFPLQINDGRVHYDGENIGLINVGGTFGSSSFSELAGRISLEKDASIEIHSGKIKAILNEVYTWISSFDKEGNSLQDLKSVSGILQVSSLKLQGPLTMPKTWSPEVIGKIEDLIVETTLFPEPIEMKEGNLKVAENTILLTDAKVNAGDISLRMSATINHNMSELVKADIGFHGEMGKESMEWAENLVKLPPKLHIRPPLSIPDARLTWGKDSGISFVGNLLFQDGPEISIDMSLDPEGPVINNLLIEDAASSASITFSLKEKEIDFSFAGNLSHTTTDKIFLNTPLSKEWIKGDFHEHILLDHLESSTFQGVLNGGDFSLPLIQKIPFNIKDISLRADNKSVIVDSLKLTWDDNHVSVNGDVNISENGILFDLDMSADGLNFDTIKKFMDNGNKEQDKNEGEEKRFWNIPVKGILNLDAESFTFEQYTLSPVRAKISFDPDYINVKVNDANLCGISCPGVLKVTPQEISLDFQLLSQNQELGTTIQCFGVKNGLITGKFDLEAQVMARGAIEELGKSLNGNFEITARDGKYNRLGLLSKILSFLNPTEIFRGKLQGPTKEGFPYKSIAANGQMQNGILMIDEYALDAPSMRVHGQGTVDLPEKKLDIEVLVSPFNTADFVVKKIPIIRGLLGGTIVSIPVKVKGDIENPKISYLSPSAVGKKLLNTTKKVLKAPVKIIKPVIPRKKKNGSN